MDDFRAAALSPIDRAMCEFAVKLTRSPSGVARADVDSLRAIGLSDRAINDAVQVIAFFNYINRIAEGLGVDLEPEMPTRKQK